MKNKLLLFFAFVLLCSSIFAQKDSIQNKEKVYKLNYAIDIPVTVAGLLASKYGTDYLRGRKPNDLAGVPELSPKDVWWFDRGATKQDPLNADKYIPRSNILMRGAMFFPAILYLDRKVRDIWFDYTLLYLEAQAINASAYLAGSIPIPRLRPFMYNPNESLERKLDRNTTNSFFSGHTSVVATSTFFVVKVYFDLHPEAKNKLLWYGLASIPPLVAGYYRYKSGKHFPTDIVIGLAVGALTGILIPEWHKSKKKQFKLYPTVFTTGQVGVWMKMTI